MSPYSLLKIRPIETSISQQCIGYIKLGHKNALFWFHGQISVIPNNNKVNAICQTWVGYVIVPSNNTNQTTDHRQQREDGSRASKHLNHASTKQNTFSGLHTHKHTHTHLYTHTCFRGATQCRLLQNPYLSSRSMWVNRPTFTVANVRQAMVCAGRASALWMRANA